MPPDGSKAMAANPESPEVELILFGFDHWAWTVCAKRKNPQTKKMKAARFMKSSF
jgi:hypothetical protein